MKKFILILGALIAAETSFAKKVKFSVDMDTITPNVNGIHITGDFQDEAGFPADWDPATTGLVQEVSNPGIYSIVVDIPAFRHYEFKFVNGIFGYEVEFVPLESRVEYLFNDSRWIYVDSLGNDTLNIAPVIYGTNAPAGKHLLRFKVDMRNTTPIDPKGVHVAGNFQGWDPSKIFMYSFDGNIHEYITYVDTGAPSFQHEFKYYNGNATGKTETVPNGCANGSGNRNVYVSSDTVLLAVCYSQCSPCAGNAISEVQAGLLHLFPNPSNGEFRIDGWKNGSASISICDITGRVVYTDENADLSSSLRIHAVAGTYFLILNGPEERLVSKLIVE